MSSITAPRPEQEQNSIVYAHRPVVDPETYALAQRRADALRVPVRLFIDASIEAASDDPFVAENAARELSAWSDGSAVDLDEIATVLGPFATDRLILVLSSSSYRDSRETGPIERPGYGIPATSTDEADLADFVRGYLPIRTPRDEVTVIALRRGIPRLVALADDWEHVPGTRKRYASTFFVREKRRWIEATSGASKPMSRQDHALCKAVSNLVVRPNGNRNAITWLR